MEHESDGDTNCNWCSWYNHQRIGSGTGALVNKRTSRDYLNYGIVKISQNTENSPGELWWLAVTQTLVRTLVGKTLKEVKYDDEFETIKEIDSLLNERIKITKTILIILLQIIAGWWWWWKILYHIFIKSQSYPINKTIVLAETIMPT